MIDAKPEYFQGRNRKNPVKLGKTKLRKCKAFKLSSKMQEKPSKTR